MKWTEEQIWQWLEEVSDPEIPVLTLPDLGVIRKVTISDDKVLVTITPTYSGCPAMRVMEEDIVTLLKDKGVQEVEVETVLSPAWTTDWITEKGRVRLKEYGIAPPEDEVDIGVLFGKAVTVGCPLCHSKNTRMISMFGSTACKAQYQCNDCLEPFDYFKCLR